MTISGGQWFDPRVILAALEQSYVAYVVIGGLAQVLRGADQLTTGVDVCPSFAKDNIDRLARAASELDARTADGHPFAVTEQTLAAQPVIELSTNAGQLKIIASPAGVPNGYVDLRRAASKEHLGQGLQPLIASAGDLAAMSAALHDDKHLDRLPALRRIVELEANRQPALPQPPQSPPRQARRPTPRRAPRITP